LDRAAQELPEEKRLDLSEVVLTLKASGVEDVAAFRWLEPPEPRALERAHTLLTDLGALHETTRRITRIGRRMLAFPVHPRYARMLLEAHERGCVRAIALIAALSQGRGMLRRPEGRHMEQERADVLGEKEASDFFILMRAYRFAEQNHFNPQQCKRLGINGAAAREAGQTYEQFLRIAKEEKLDLERNAGNDEAIQRSILAGFTDQVAMRADTGTLRCNLVHERRGVLARESVVHHSPLLVASDVREIQGKDGEFTVLLNTATAIEEEWLRELLPDAFRTEEKVVFDSVQRRVITRRQILFRDLLLKAEVTEKAPKEEAARVLADAVTAGTCVLVNWDHAVEQWITRLNRLREWMPELELPEIGDAERRMLVEQICHGAMTYKEIKERAVWPVVKSWLSTMQEEMVEKFAPERISLPNGKKWKIVYDAKAAPVIAARIQELYGVEGSLTIAAGRVPLVIQVLAPNQRPVQVTQNLSTFWKESYPKIKQELQRKYPKHEWR
jgi:ATP-dependent helicase HrpB